MRCEDWRWWGKSNTCQVEELRLLLTQVLADDHYGEGLRQGADQYLRRRGRQGIENPTVSTGPSMQMYDGIVARLIEPRIFLSGAR